MAGSSSSTRDVCTATLSPKVKSTEKKKRKRPSKKVPTTVLESSSTNFMNLVQKLTGSAGELAAAKSNASSSLTNSVASTSLTSSPYSSPSCDYIDSQLASDSFYQHFLRSAAAMAAPTSSFDNNNNNDDDDSSHSNYTPFPNPNAHHQVVAPSATAGHFHQSPDSSYYNVAADDDDFYSPYPSASSSRALENEISPFSSAWRDPIGSHSEYWTYQQMDMRA